MGAQHSKDFAYGIGPWIVTLDEIPSVIGLEGQVRVNGEVWSNTKVEDFIWTPEETVSYVSQFDGLQPGDLIGSGTMAFGAGVELQTVPAARRRASSSSSRASACCARRSRPRRRPRRGGRRRSPYPFEDEDVDQ